MLIPRRWWSSGLYIWVDLYRQRQLYRQYVQAAREVKRLRKVRDEERRWERLSWTYGDHKAMQGQAARFHGSYYSQTANLIG